MKNQDQSFVRLLKKISALRATLSDDERIMLDARLHIRYSDEVVAHSMGVTPISPAKSAAKATSPDEVRANSMKVSTAKSAAKATAPDEARANSMKVSTAKSTSKATSADEVKANALSYRIVYNPTKDEYQIIQ